MLPAPIIPMVLAGVATAHPFYAEAVRRLAVSVYSLLLVGEVLWSAVFPLGPYYHDRFALSATETGAITAAASIAILVVSIPAGMLTDRIGARRMTIAAAVALTASAAGHALATSFVSLLAVRVLFGIGFGALWPASLAYLTGIADDRIRARLLSSSIVVAGLGTTIGPVVGGLLTERYGLGVPFGGAALFAAAFTALLIAGPPVAATHEEPVRLLTALARLTREPLAIVGMLCMVLPGFVANTVHLLVPLRLHEQGISDSRIGLALAAGAAVFFVASLTTTARGSSIATLGTAALAMAGVGVVFCLPLVTTSPDALYGFLLLRAPPIALLFTISVPLTAAGARRQGVGQGAVLGLMNALWAVAAIAGPLAAGALDDHVGHSATWVVDVALCLAVAAATVRWRVRDATSSGASATATSVADR
jgi:MFS family permease